MNTLQGIEKSCSNSGLDLLFFCNVYHSNQEAIYRQLISGKVDGIILFADTSNPVAQLLASGILPAVAVADIHENMASISMDPDPGTTQLVELLYEYGHREAVFISPVTDFESVKRRRQSFETCMAEKGINLRNVRVDWADNYEHIIKSVQSSGNPTVVCCWSDIAAYQFLAVCRSSGVNVPEDISITGFDGFLDGQFPARRVTTVKIPWADIASVAVTSLIKIRAGEDVEPNIIYSTRLQPGDTVGDVRKT